MNIAAYAPILRIVLRYVAGFLVAKGVLDSATADQVNTDPEFYKSFETLVGVALAGINELWYRWAKKNAKAL